MWRTPSSSAGSSDASRRSRSAGASDSSSAINCRKGSRSSRPPNARGPPRIAAGIAPQGQGATRVEAARAPGSDHPFLKERLLTADHVGDDEQQRRHPGPPQVRERELLGVAPPVVKGDEQRAGRQRPSAPARGQHVVKPDNVVVAPEEPEARGEEIVPQAVLGIGGGPARIRRRQHPVKHHHREPVAIPAAVIGVQRTRAVECALHRRRLHDRGEAAHGSLGNPGVESDQPSSVSMPTWREDGCRP